MKKDSKLKELILGLVIFSLALFIFSIGTHSMSYSSPDEKRYIQSTEEMIETCDWITPRYHGRPRFQKPILFYWLAALGIALFKNSLMGARLPSAICGAMVVLLTYLLAKDMYNRRTGLFSASLLAISWLFFLYSKLSTPDMATLSFITLSLYIFFKLYFQNTSSKIKGSLFFIALALATLTKGLVGLFIPIIIISIFTAIFKWGNLHKKMNIPLGLSLFLFITLPWFLTMYKIHGHTYIKHIWQVETVNRVRDLWGTDTVYLKILKNLFSYSVKTLIVFLPSTVLLPKAAIGLFRRKDVKRQDLLILIWIFTVIIFFSFIGTQKTHYLLLLAPPLCIMMARYALDFAQRKSAFRTIFIFFIIITLSLYTAAFGYLLPHLSKEDGLLILSQEILSIIKEGDEVGVGSHFISHNRVNSYLGISAKKVNVDLGDPGSQIAKSRQLLTEFLNKENRVFCLITRQDYQDYISEELRGRIFILDKGWYWKKPNQLKLDRSAISSILRKDKAAFKNEIYLISNKLQ